MLQLQTSSLEAPFLRCTIVVVLDNYIPNQSYFVFGIYVNVQKLQDHEVTGFELLFQDL